MMGLPGWVKIGPIYFSIRENIPGALPSDLCGCIDYEAASITIKPGMDARCEAQVLSHELVHGLLYATGESDHDEKAVDRMAMALTDMVLSSPELLEYWGELADG